MGLLDMEDVEDDRKPVEDVVCPNCQTDNISTTLKRAAMFACDNENCEVITFSPKENLDWSSFNYIHKNGEAKDNEANE